MHEQVWKYGIFFNQTVKTNIREKNLSTAIEIFAIYNQVFEGRILFDTEPAIELEILFYLFLRTTKLEIYATS